MRRVVFSAILAVAAATISVRAEEPPKLANTNFPSRMTMPMRPDILKEFDKDGDGKLNEQEMAAMIAARRAKGEMMRKAMEKEFDKDGDGKLNDEERKAMMAEMQKRRANAPQYQEMLKRFDKDGDGKLNDEERKAMMEERAKHMHQKDVTPPAAGAPVIAPTP